MGNTKTKPVDDTPLIDIKQNLKKMIYQIGDISVKEIIKKIDRKIKCEYSYLTDDDNPDNFILHCGTRNKKHEKYNISKYKINEIMNKIKNTVNVDYIFNYI
jgi:hypothetical protein